MAATESNGKNEHLDRIQRSISNAMRCFESEDLDCNRILIELRQSQRCLSLMQLSESSYQDIDTTISELINQIEMRIQMKSKQGNEFKAPRRKLDGRAGRPAVIIEDAQLKMLYDANYTAPQMAKRFGCSLALVYKKLHEAGLKQRDRYSKMEDTELDEKIQGLQKTFPNAGSVMMHGILQKESGLVQRKRVRDSINRVSPVPVINRLSKTIKRRHYSVAMSNSLWHLDGHMKLIRWGISTHGCIDGYSRLITFLQADLNNKASTVLGHFVNACTQYGIPSRVRTDHGGENVMVALFVNLMNGEERHSNLTGRSVHNQRIERLWKDVFQQVVEKFYNLFSEMEDRGLLDIECKYNLLALHMVYLPVISENLESFRQGWNNHKLSTENNLTPHQLWLNGILDNINSNSKAMENLQTTVQSRLDNQLRNYGLNPEDFQERLVEDREIITPEQKEEMTNILAENLSDEDKYLSCLNFLTRAGYIQ